MPTRSRSRVRGSAAPGYYVVLAPNGSEFGARNYGVTGTTSTELCNDSTQPRPYVHDQNLEIVSKRAEPLRLHGTVPWMSGYKYFADGFNPINRTLAASCPLPTAQNMSYWMTKALANMNPNTPKVDVPLFLFELRELPRMLKEIGDFEKSLPRNIPSSVPRAHLSWSFGWAPLVSDLMALARLAKLTEDRFAYLKALEKGSRIKRKLFSDEIQRSVSVNGYTVFFGSMNVFQADILLTEYLDVWFTANAKLLAPLPDADKMPELALKLALGLSARPETLWNAFPWSWLIDYFINVSDVLSATGGFIPWQATRMNVMAMQTVRSDLIRIRKHSAITSVGHRLETVSKRRAVNPTPIPIWSYEPILNGSQKAILGSLLTLSFLREKHIAR